ncbi:MAG: carbohydrate-binding family 9-like protein [Saprospiraceae bacterium]|nr:carbohydrate-binding family 9-like protein [Saprospiraceae bacterium]MCB9321983.1 carbohydrate-binding family 9-like protein [Lewinellaceae bacterium]
MRRTITIIVWLTMYFPVAAQGYHYETPRHYRCEFTGLPVTIDGQGDDLAWQGVAWSELFVDIEGDSRPLPYQNTRVKMVWDSTQLYILARLDETNIWATLKNHDDIIYRDNDFEVFIDPDRDSHNYFEIEFNAFNTIFDLFLSAPYRDGGPVITDWDFKQMRSAVKVYGSLNNPSDRDSCWSVEMALPLDGLTRKGRHPDPGAVWKINFSRVHHETQVVDGQYVKLRTPEGKPMPEHNWVWAPQGIVNMHYPEKWGYLLFDRGPDRARIPEDDAVIQHLYFLYHQLREYRAEHGVFPDQLENQYLVNGMHYACSFLTADSDYLLTLHGERNRTWAIREDGRVTFAAP